MSESESMSDSFRDKRRDHGKHHDRQMREHQGHEDKLIGEEEFNPNPRDFDEEEGEDWGRHGKKKHHGKKGKHHGFRLGCFLLTALVFTLFGVCMARCCQRRNKCQKKYKKMMEEKNVSFKFIQKTSKDIEKNIKENYEEIEKLQT